MARGLNFDPAGQPAGPGWHVDDVRQPLPTGSFDLARTLLREYKIADPRMVRASFDPAEPLLGRTMELELRFYGLRFRVSVRVDDAYDERRDLDGRWGRVSGWAYRTLEGHLEMGQMAWEVWCFEDTGEILFRIHAYSRPAPVANPVVRLGVRLFARREQLRFYRRARERMLDLTRAAAASPAR